jgi:hypothetical protein
MRRFDPEFVRGLGCIAFIESDCFSAEIIRYHEDYVRLVFRSGIGAGTQASAQRYDSKTDPFEKVTPVDLFFHLHLPFTAQVHQICETVPRDTVFGNHVPVIAIL